MELYLLLCVCLALIQQVSSTPSGVSDEGSSETAIEPWTPGSSSLEDDPLFLRLVEKLAAEPISPDQKAALLHKFEQADEDTQVLIYTSVMMEQTEPILRCAACEAAIGEVQLAMMSNLKEAARKDPNAPHWTSHWFELPTDEKISLVEEHFSAELCSNRMRLYGLHPPSKAYVPFQMGVRTVPGVESSEEITQYLVNQCRYLEFALKEPIAGKLGNDTSRLHRQIVSKGGSLELQMQAVWHAIRKETCNTVTRADGACHKQQHPFAPESNKRQVADGADDKYSHVDL
uniref:Uncharacterized protein n=1 Tax=Pyramimonas obovata TaxID=1411642 RepID=A0A7S0RGD5_9CHLO|mmetsp:Transcript_33274/g.72599  ORF Transcript_33274/g.72599 Transcript_33274/m.72599 type:complete len:288 (+) Transcript_33274:249-1112(+)|eukprot:CAMPEP_0118930642 /NCGR_PEP_ID=MMETSP1169-20130426/7258_1 /TAXON_ID=36882 /ORGANISM="Pyramimonas obovata, Strain CCMP722" /LENGTH=287 /DNA_ID=CAMNT_0006873027 /DNA_START=185 /DNA_END=1048 /DNA_ORIENTATION=+